MDVTIKLDATPALCSAIQSLAAALSGANFTPANPTQRAAPTSSTYAVAATIPQMPPPAQVAPVAVSAPTAPAPTATTAAPVTPAANPTPAAPPVVPVAAAPTFTHEQIRSAGAPLVDAGKTNDLMRLLGAFGVQSIPQLLPEQLGAFATELRRLGAQI